MTFYGTDLSFAHDCVFSQDARAIAPELVRLFAARGLRGGRILELGCGSGVTAAYLVDRGFGVAGIDLSAAMVRLARRRVPAARFRWGDIGSAELPEADAAIAIGEVVNYATSKGHGVARLRRLARSIRGALPSGGIFIFDFMESASGRTYAAKVHEGDGWSLVVSARAAVAGRWVTRTIEVHRRLRRGVRVTRERHRVRVFTREEISAAFETAGFRVRFQRRLGRFQAMRGDAIAIATAA